ncbi:MAG: LysR family transcriptional regulator [Gammaproteobacteria bacterium]
METLAGMRVFARVVEAGSFSEAGRQLGLAPSSVSRQINELEDSLGALLFQRTTRKLSLTEAGELYYERTTSIVTEVDEAKLAISQLDGTPTGILRLNVHGSLSRRYIVPIVVAFQEKFPRVEIVLLASDQVLDMIEHRIDLTIRLGVLKDSSLVARKIGSGRRVLCASTAYLDNTDPPKSTADLALHNCLTFRENPGSNIWKFKNSNGVLSEVSVTGNLYANDGESLVAAAAMGHGIILVPEWLVNCELREGTLQEILTNYTTTPKETPMYALYPRQRHLPPKVRAFIDFIVERFSNK